MWDSECQRLGKKKCTPFGFQLHILGDLLGATGFLALILVVGYFTYRWWFVDDFELSLLWLLLVPFGLGIAGSILFSYSWRLAYSKSFEYDDENRIASWHENGRRIEFRYEDDSDH